MTPTKKTLSMRWTCPARTQARPQRALSGYPQVGPVSMPGLLASDFDSLTHLDCGVMPLTSRRSSTDPWISVAPPRNLSGTGSPSLYVPKRWACSTRAA